MLSRDHRSQVTDFIKSDPAIYSFYLLKCDQHSQKDTLESYCRFLLWLILAGRKEYKYPLVIPKAIRDIVSSPNSEGRHLLMDVALSSMVGEIKDGHEARARYYFHALPKFALGPFVGRAEIVEFNRSGTILALARLAATFNRQGGDSSAETAHLVNQLARISSAVPTPTMPSVSIVGYHRSVLGLGEDVRSLFDCLLDAGVTAELIDISPMARLDSGDEAVLARFNRAHIYKAFESSRPNGSVVIFCMPVFEMMRTICMLGLVPTRQQYWIGYWPWETTELSPGWINAFEFVSEVWASTRFLYETYSKQTRRPVFHIPLNIQVLAPIEPDGIGSLLGSKFTFLSIFDFNSRIERKNPLGAIAAFCRAFPKKTENVQLVLKAIHGERRSDNFDVVRKAADEDKRIVLKNEVLSGEEICWLIQNSQVYVSLHRSEGFGRPIAEAMLLGTPVIATGWSGSTDFLSEETGFPIGYRLRPVAPSEYPFAAGEWAEPDIGHAAAVMRHLYERGGASPNIVLNAKRLITKLFSRTSIGTKLVERLVAIDQVLTSDDRLRARTLPDDELYTPHDRSSNGLPDFERPQTASLKSGPIELHFGY
jgi:glycosyltransferase involved in cell wall biosynthesis